MDFEVVGGNANRQADPPREGVTLGLQPPGPVLDLGLDFLGPDQRRVVAGGLARRLGGVQNW